MPWCFNTTLVQLKVAPCRSHPPSFWCFNTTLVQLKGRLITTIPVRPEGLFQYHTGPIKSTLLLRHGFHPCRFQYHTGPIKRWISARATTEPRRFQYHTGPIKREIDMEVKWLGCTTCFNTTLVQLKGRWLCARTRRTVRFQYHTGPIKRRTAKPFSCYPNACVSIPHWSN